jgi:hypothetical protein
MMKRDVHSVNQPNDWPPQWFLSLNWLSENGRLQHRNFQRVRVYPKFLANSSASNCRIHEFSILFPTIVVSLKSIFISPHTWTKPNGDPTLSFPVEESPGVCETNNAAQILISTNTTSATSCHLLARQAAEAGQRLPHVHHVNLRCWWMVPRSIKWRGVNCKTPHEKLQHLR